jgi:phosphocarrier protein HPr
MRQATVVVQHEAGLHARPAAQFVKLAKQFNANISVTSKGKTVSAKSLVLILTLGVQSHTEIEVTADGPDEQEAVTALVKLVESNFSDQSL